MITQACSSGSSGSSPSARIHRRWYGPGCGHLVVPGQLADVALVDRMRASRTTRPAPPGRAGAAPTASAASRGRAPRASANWWRDAALLEVVERRLHVVDGPPVLNRHHPAGGEGAAVADAVDLVEDGHGRVAGSEEVRVERVHAPVLDRATRRHERLPGHLAAEHALAFLVELGAPEDVHLNGLEVQKADEELQGLAHGSILAGRHGRPVRVRAHRPVAPATLRRRGQHRKRNSSSRPPFSGASPRRPTRSRAATSTTTGGPGSTIPSRARSNRAATPATPSHRWREDVQLVADMGLGAYRFSLEWSRIEPAEGEFSVAALEHYRRICAALLGHGIAPVVTFHHFTTPLWLTARGGWESPDAPERFARYVGPGHRLPGRPHRLGLHHQRAQRRRP